MYQILIISLSILITSTVSAREYGEIMTVHAGDVDGSKNIAVECHVKIKQESSNRITSWLQVRKNSVNYQPTGCSILLSAYMSNKRIGYDVRDGDLINICFADKLDC